MNYAMEYCAVSNTGRERMEKRDRYELIFKSLIKEIPTLLLTTFSAVDTARLRRS